jgi:hypothetical protein
MTNLGPHKINWQSWRRAIFSTIGALGVYLGAILCRQIAQQVPSPPLYAVQAGGGYALLRDYTIAVSNVSLTIKAGYSAWDGLSIPHSLTGRLQITFSDYPDASLFHDIAYAGELFPKAFSDECLRIILLRDGCDQKKADAVWQAVHDFGFTAYDRHTKESMEYARGMVMVESK